jgi:2-haloacid dehalogenase
MALDRVKALVFDVFGTVVDWRGSIAAEAEAFAGRNGLKLDDPNRFALDWRALYQPAMDKVRKGEMGFVKLDVLHRMNLDELLARYGYAGLPEAEVDNLNNAWHRLTPWPDAVPALTRLRAKYILGTMSNGNVRLMVDMAKHAGLPWDVILGAEISRSYKPEPKTYLTGVDYLSMQPDEVALVAAHNSDLVAASKCGLATAYVNRPYEYGDAQTRDTKAEHDFDVVAESFADLADKLGC